MRDDFFAEEELFFEAVLRAEEDFLGDADFLVVDDFFAEDFFAEVFFADDFFVAEEAFLRDEVFFLPVDLVAILFSCDSQMLNNFAAVVSSRADDKLILGIFPPDF